MKIYLKTLGIMLALAFALLPNSEQVLRADDNNSVSFQTFYDQLSNQGTWIQTNDYGYVFQPTVNDPNWRPYTYGHWVSTDQGMMWASDEPFGWATYHYGRWVNLDNYGWVWVPGYTWAPAWVSWRESEAYYGWAPLPPDTLVGIDFFDPGIWFGFGFGFHIGGDCDLAFGIGPGCYNFCPVAYIGDPQPWRYYANRGNNYALINGTRNVTNLNVANGSRAGRFGRVTADGPASLATMNARSRTPIRQASLTSASTLAANGRTHGNSLSVYAPNVDPASAKTARPHSVSTSLATTSVNRGTDINHPLAVNSHLSPAGATPEQTRAATSAQNNAPTSAKIATANTHFSRPLSQPLTSLRANTTAESRTTGEATGHPSAATSPTESRYTGESAIQHTPTSSEAESRYTGEAATHHTSTPTVAGSRYTGEPAVHHTSTVPHEPAIGSVYHPSNTAVSSYHPSSISHPSASVFHSSAPAYHPQSSFHPSASAPHFGGGAPTTHFSGGGGGGRPSGGGGGGGGRGGNGGNQHH